MLLVQEIELQGLPRHKLKTPSKMVGLVNKDRFWLHAKEHQDWQDAPIFLYVLLIICCGFLWGCSVFSAAGTVVSTTASVAGTAVSTAASVAESAVNGAVSVVKP